MNYRLDAYHALGKCAEAKCSKEHTALLTVIKEGEKNNPKFEETVKKCKDCLAAKKYEEMSDEEKRTLLECLKVNWRLTYWIKY